jgi:hypothetical protein
MPGAAKGVVAHTVRLGDTVTGTPPGDSGSECVSHCPASGPRTLLFPHRPGPLSLGPARARRCTVGLTPITE